MPPCLLIMEQWTHPLESLLGIQLLTAVHILVGPNTRTCEANGNWSPDAPTCLGELVIDNSCYVARAVLFVCSVSESYV